MEFYVKTNDSVLELPRLYYLGYKITLNGKSISYYENKNGFIEIKVKEHGKIKIQYEGTKGYKISIVLLVITLCSTIIYVIKKEFDF